MHQSSRQARLHVENACQSSCKTFCYMKLWAAKKLISFLFSGFSDIMHMQMKVASGGMCKCGVLTLL